MAFDWSQLITPATKIRGQWLGSTKASVTSIGTAPMRSAVRRQALCTTRGSQDRRCEAAESLVVSLFESLKEHNRPTCSRS